MRGQETHSLISPALALLIKRHRRCMSPTHFLTTDAGMDKAVLRSRALNWSSVSMYFAGKAASCARIFFVNQSLERIAEDVEVRAAAG